MFLLKESCLGALYDHESTGACSSHGATSFVLRYPITLSLIPDSVTAPLVLALTQREEFPIFNIPPSTRVSYMICARVPKGHASASNLATSLHPMVDIVPGQN